jgi:hypothetical protein
MDGMSMKNEQSDNPVENYHKIKPPGAKKIKKNPIVKEKAPIIPIVHETFDDIVQIELDDSEGKNDSPQPFKKFGVFVK